MGNNKFVGESRDEPDCRASDCLGILKIKKLRKRIMMNEKCKCEKHIKGINCSVKNCVYHDGETYCTAENIHVGPTHAEKSADTVCATFKCDQTCG